MNLIPTEHWEYTLADLIDGLATATGKETNHHEIVLSGIGNGFTTGSGRTALVLALRALGLKSGARIGVPLYCCPVVFRAIEVAGCTPVFIDTTADTCCISADDLKNKIDTIDAVVAVHMFGNLCDVPALKAVAGRKPIIEDCAQALGSKTGDSPAGSLGDIAFFSFRSGKYLSAGEGGAVFSANPEYRDRLAILTTSLPQASKLNEIVHTSKTYMRSKLRSKPLYGFIGHKLWAFYNKTAAPAVKASISMNGIYKSDHALAVKRVKTLDDAIGKQRDNARFYTHQLNLEQGMTCAEKPGTFYNRYLYPVLFTSSQQRDRMAEYLFKQGIGAIKPYQDIASVAASSHGYGGDCPVSEKIAAGVLAIPNHYKLTLHERRHIGQNVNEAWSVIRNKS